MDKEETEKAIVDWIKTQDNNLWLIVVRPYMTATARQIINRHSGNELPFEQDIVNDMTTHVALKLLQLDNYDKQKGSIRHYIFVALKRHYFNCYRSHTAVIKRGDYRLSHCLHEMLEQGKDIPQQDDKTYFIDKDFLNYFCEWWRSNTNNKYILAIIDTLSTTTLGNKEYSLRAIARKTGIRYNRLTHAFRAMKRESPKILKEYLK